MWAPRVIFRNRALLHQYGYLSPDYSGICKKTRKQEEEIGDIIRGKGNGFVDELFIFLDIPEEVRNSSNCECRVRSCGGDRRERRK